MSKTRYSIPTHKCNLQLTVVQRIDGVNHQLKKSVSELGRCRSRSGRSCATTRTRRRRRSAFGSRSWRHRTTGLSGHRCFRWIGSITLRRGGGGQNPYSEPWRKVNDGCFEGCGWWGFGLERRGRSGWDLVKWVEQDEDWSRLIN